ncbi:MAG: hypothetical protein C0594_13460 [Marinilabiliales bacterium]|nr:MAG: hypothetical protein C0594_13460 [Marinilabiliales bacterium]
MCSFWYTCRISTSNYKQTQHHVGQHIIKLALKETISTINCLGDKTFDYNFVFVTKCEEG